ncbi:MAG: YjjG family noncanonical pyrimidine nucleotidase [Ilumatobacter sp.]|uniref:YjjG family noncanonical pyrimidine nucleotidase n=1 Tax=Ilumatobacter sp. TaxID=1967498 RepID=UPI002603D45A|nr:YjjG family noncanonical pyrimidine nucleotidase [Ilumatobacter sp.]MDJ0771074.1 YjjG family noncanonical pyrimidine nucleotidase [Ilumatobacter sp.]
MRYSTLLFDLDHTLLDSDASERLAYAHTMATVGVTDGERHFERYVAINRGMWTAVERGEMQPTDVRHRRFEQFNGELGLAADPHDMADAFVWGLGAFGDLYDGALAVLDQLAARASLALVTNGLSDVQRARIERLGLGDYFDAVVISSEVGVTKPRPEIFDVAFEQLGRPSKVSAVMIGDSLTSDIKGGAEYGIATCWFNPNGAQAGPGDGVTHEVADLAELPTVV